MRRLLGTVVVVLHLLGLQNAATAGVLWFQTTDRNVGDRTGAGVLTLPAFEPEGPPILAIWTSRRVMVLGDAASRS